MRVAPPSQTRQRICEEPRTTNIWGIQAMQGQNEVHVGIIHQNTFFNAFPYTVDSERCHIGPRHQGIFVERIQVNFLVYGCQLRIVMGHAEVQSLLRLEQGSDSSFGNKKSVAQWFLFSCHSCESRSMRIHGQLTNCLMPLVYIYTCVYIYSNSRRPFLIFSKLLHSQSLIG